MIPLHPNRHVIPDEVFSILDEKQREQRSARRLEVQRHVLEEDHAPRRARFSDDPASLVLAIALTVRDQQLDVHAERGTPKSLINRFSTRFGAEPECVAMLVALSRTLGLWEPAAADGQAPPGSWTLAELSERLFDVWLRGGAWDEAREDGELLRAAGDAREATAVTVIRAMVLDALRELGEGRWLPWEAVAGYVRTDSRTPGVGRLLERWAVRHGCEVPTALDVARRMVFHSLFVLGVVDLGDVELSDDQALEDFSPSLRLTRRGRAFLNAETEALRGEGTFVDNQTLRVPNAARVADVLNLAQFVDVGRITGKLDLAVTPAGVARAIATGITGDGIRESLARLADIPDPIEQLLKQASAVVGRAEFVEVGGFLWVDDKEVRQLLRTRKQTMDLFVDPSPPGGLLLKPGLVLDRVTQRCRTLGVEVLVDGEAYRARSTSPPRRSTTPPPRRGSNDDRESGTFPVRRGKTTRRSRSG